MAGGKDKRVVIQDPKFKSHYMHDNFGALQRARSFVHPGQLQHEQNRELLQQKRRSGIVVATRGKPAMELYKPPTMRPMRHFDGYDIPVIEPYGGKSAYDMFYPQDKHNSSVHSKRKSALNINAKEFQPDKLNGDLRHSKSGINLKTNKNSIDHTYANNNKENRAVPDNKVKFDIDKKPNGFSPGVNPGATPIKRSKSLGSADMMKAVNGSCEDSGIILESFPPENRKVLSAALDDPNQLSARQLMEVVRHVFAHVAEASKNSEPSARFCVQIIQREANETFLETLLNTCQEYYQERDRLLRTSPTNGGRTSPSSHPRWIAFMKFLYELYTQLKRHHGHLMSTRMKNGGTPAGILLLTLIAQCCCVCLQKTNVNSMTETECLFFVLTTVGKDIETKLPQQMDYVIGTAREALLTTARMSSVRKTLLQLIEMHAAKWQLPAQAVMYYYPGSCAKI